MKHIVTKVFTLLLFAILFTGCHSTPPATLADLSSRYINVEGCRVHYKAFGHGDKTIIFIHGFGCDMNVWEHQYEAFCHDTIRLIFVDLPGFGLSDKPHAEYTLDYFAHAVESVLKAEKVTKPILVGHSLGTPVCLCVEHRDNICVAGICDVDGVYCLYPQDPVALPRYEQAVQGFAQSFCGGDVRQNIINFVHSLSGPDTPQEITQYALSTMPNTLGYVACSTMSHLIEHTYWDLWSNHQVCVPSLVVCTKNSGLEPDNEQQMNRFFANMTYWELDTCGHFIMWEQAEEFNQKLHNLVSNL